MNRVLALSLALATAAGALAGTGPRLPRWRFERGTDEWESRDTRVARSAQKAHEGGYSLQVDVDFPRPVSVFRRVNYHIDLIGRIVYHVYVPREAPDDVKTMLFLKNKDGLWFQHFFERSLERGRWNEVSLEISASSPHLRPSAHHKLWDSVTARGMNQIGVKFFSNSEFKGRFYLDDVRTHRVAPKEAPLRVLNLRENGLEVGRYEKFEITFDINRHVTNPFDPEHIRIDACFLDPEGKASWVPAFFSQDFVRRIKNDREELIPVGAGRWKVRFAPVVAGPHSYYLRVDYTPDRLHAGGEDEKGAKKERLVTGKRAFLCVDSESRGFVRVCKKDPNYFAFDNGEWFYPIGHNVHSPTDDTPRAVKIQEAIGADIMPDHGTFVYDYLFKRMAANGENFAEVWMCSWWVGIEWLRDWRNYNGLTRYNLHSAWRLDYLVDLAKKHDLYLHLVVDNHGKASTWTDPEWEDNPYNEINGGFLGSPQDFFRLPYAKEIYKKKLRYIIARWGYSTRIAGIELWSEVDLVGDSWNFHANDVEAAPKVQWHREMTEYLDQIDPWDHLLTTHFSTNYGRIKPTLASLPGIDYNATDIYSMPLIRYVVASAACFNGYGKPGIVTEYGGAGPFGSPPAVLRAHLHAGMWATYMTHTAGTPLLWWFQFIESDDLYWNFKALAAYHAGEERRGESLVQRIPTFPNPHHDLGAMSLQNTRKAYVWVYSKSAMESMPKSSRSRAFKGTSVLLTGYTPGQYRVEVWDTHKGTITAKLDIKAQGNALIIPLPDFAIDCALKVKPAS